MRRRAAYVLVWSSYVGAAINAVSGFVFVPWYLHAFGLSTYGAWLASGNVLGLLGLLDGAVNQVVAQRLAETYGSGDMQRFARLAGSAITIAAVAFAVLIVAMGVGAPLIVGHLDFEGVDMQRLAIATGLAGIGTALAFLQATLSAFTSAWQRPMLPSIGVVCGQLAALVGIAVGLLSGLGVIALGVGALLRSVVICGFGLVALGRDWRLLQIPRPIFVKADTRELVRSSIPMTGARLASVVLNHSESALVALLLGADAAGVLGITGRLYALAGMLVHPITGAASAGLSHLFGTRDIPRLRIVFDELFATSAAVSALFLVPVFAVNERLLMVWVGYGKYAGTLADAALAMQAVLLVRTNLLQVALVAVGGYALGFLCSAVELVVRLSFVFGLAHVIGIAAAPVATIASSLAIMLVIVAGHRGLAERADVPWLRLITRGAIPLLTVGITVVAIRVLASRFVIETPSWPALCVFAASSGLVCMIAVAATSPVVRQRLTARLRAVA